jgi:Tn3 transposase DDE domain/Universal stress protein family
VFSSAERESAYVIDGLMHNEVVKSDIHSTDAFGFSELVFAVSHLLGFSYAPRFKNLERQRLYIFRSRKGSDRSAWKIKLIVISTHRYPWYVRLFNGSDAEDILRQAPCPVLIVQQEEHDFVSNKPDPNTWE